MISLNIRHTPFRIMALLIVPKSFRFIELLWISGLYLNDFGSRDRAGEPR